jgi:cysteine-rich repeat protein
MLRRIALALALALGAVGISASDAGARPVTVRWSHPDATGITAFRVYVRQSEQSYGTPAWQGLPAPSGGVYAVELTVADDATVHTVGTAINSDGESAFSNELTFAPPAPSCGDGSLDPGEACDDGNTASGDGCSSACLVERVPACGDGVLDPGEACDDGNATSGDGCRANCTIEACGDGVRDASEACDDGNATSGDGCSSTCLVERVPACGDGVLDPGEACDDGNATSGDGCDLQCRAESPVCGDGRLDAGEQCDDGNSASGDGCDAACQMEDTTTLLPLRVNVGGPDYIDPAGLLWREGATFVTGGSSATSGTGIRNTSADLLYQSRAYGDARSDAEPVTVDLPVEGEGLYRLRLHFAEVVGTTRSGQRVFDVLVEEALTIPDVDVVAQVGSYRPLKRELLVYVTDQSLSLRLVPKAGRPMLSGIEVERADEEAAAAPEPRICHRRDCR